MKVKTKKSLMVVLAFALVAFVTLAMVGITPSKQPVYAEDAYTVKNIEDVVDSFDDLIIIETHSSTVNKYDADDVNKILSISTNKYGLFSELPTDDTSSLNTNKYLGDLCVATSNASLYFGAYFDAGENGVVSFRTVWSDSTASQHYFFGQSVVSKAYNSNEGYHIDVNWQADNNRWIASIYGNGSNTLKGADTPSNYDCTLTAGDVITVTMGTYKNADDQNVALFKMYNETIGKTAISFNVADKKGLLVRSEESSDKWYMGYSSPYGGSSSRIIGGINQPVIREGYDVEIDGEYFVGDNYSSVQLPQGYAIKEDGALLAGVNRIPVTTTIEDYYGKQATVDCYATVNVSAYMTTAIEDMLSNEKEMTLSNSTFFGVSKGYHASAVLNELQTVSSQTYAVYTKAKTDTDDTVNANSFDGDLSIYNATASATKGYIIKAQSENQILQFRTVYQGQRINLKSWASSGKPGYTDVNWGDGYFFYIQPRSDGIAYFNQKFVSASSVTTVYTAETTGPSSVSTGDVLNIKFGVYQINDANYDYNGDGTADGAGVYAIFSVYNETTSTSLKSWHYKDTSDGSLYRAENTTDNYFTIQFVSDTDASPVTMMGVNQPIIESVYDLYFEAEKGATIDDIEIPAGYALKNPAATLEAGSNKLAATYTISDYYGVEANIDCEIEVLVDGNKVFFVDADGNTVKDTVYLDEGESCLLEKVEVADKVFVGWKTQDGKLYPANYALEVNEDVTLTLVNVTFRTAGASLRLADNSDGFGGLRFAVEFDATSQLGAVDWYGFILPLDLLSGSTELNDGVVELAKSNNTHVKVGDMATFKNGAKGAIFTLLDIMHTNYNRKFFCAAYMEITYENGQTEKIFTNFDAEKDVRTVYSVAVTALADTSEEYDENQLKVLNTYVNSVIELDGEYNKVGSGDYTVECSLDGSQLTITLTTDVVFNQSSDGLIYIPLLINGVRYTTVATAIEGGYTVTVNVG